VRRGGSSCVRESSGDRRTAPIHAMSARDVVRHTDAGAAALLPADRRGARQVPPWLRGAGGGRTARETSSLDALSDARGGIMSELPLDAAGRRRSPVTSPEFHAGRPPRNQGMRYPADRPTVEEVVGVKRRAGDGVHGHRLRGLIVVLWRAGCGSVRRSRSPRPIWTRAAVRCWCGAERRPRAQPVSSAPGSAAAPTCLVVESMSKPPSA
jgi:hypothetical protein